MITEALRDEIFWIINMAWDSLVEFSTRGWATRLGCMCCDFINHCSRLSWFRTLPGFKCRQGGPISKGCAKAKQWATQWMVFGAKYKNHITKTNKHSESGKMKHMKNMIWLHPKLRSLGQCMWSSWFLSSILLSPVSRISTPIFGRISIYCFRNFPLEFSSAWFVFPGQNTNIVICLRRMRGQEWGIARALVLRLIGIPWGSCLIHSSGFRASAGGWLMSFNELRHATPTAPHTHTHRLQVPLCSPYGVFCVFG